MSRDLKGDQMLLDRLARSIRRLLVPRYEELCREKDARDATAEIAQWGFPQSSAPSSDPPGGNRGSIVLCADGLGASSTALPSPAPDTPSVAPDGLGEYR
jgi:hypothetical protein